MANTKKNTEKNAEKNLGNNTERNLKKKSEPNKVHRYVSNDFSLRASVVDATHIVREMAQLQQTKPLATVAVGRAMIGALLMASHSKEGHQVGLLFKGNGPLGSVYADATFIGEVRGYVHNPDYQPVDYSGGLKVAPALGSGNLTVIRNLPHQRQPHQGTVSLVSGEIGEDIAHYLKQSQQIRSLITLGVYLDEGGDVLAAGGVLIEVMPGVEEEIVDQLFENTQKVEGNLSEKIKSGFGPQELISPYLEGIPFTKLDHEYTVHYHCPCTKERVSRAIEILGLTELEDMIQKKESPEIRCQMCGRLYHMSCDEVREVRDRVLRESMH